MNPQRAVSKLLTGTGEAPRNLSKLAVRPLLDAARAAPHLCVFTPANETFNAKILYDYLLDDLAARRADEERVQRIAHEVTTTFRNAFAAYLGVADDS